MLERWQHSGHYRAIGLSESLFKLWPALWMFLSLAAVEPTNNHAEQAIRPAVLWPKSSFASDSAAGSRFAERLLTVVASCRQQGRPVLDLLVDAGKAARHGPAAPSLVQAP